MSSFASILTEMAESSQPLFSGTMRVGSARLGSGVPGIHHRDGIPRMRLAPWVEGRTEAVKQ